MLGKPRSAEFMQSIVEATDINALREQHTKHGKQRGADMTYFEENGLLPIYRKGDFV